MFLLRRLANYVLLVAVATSLAYLLAASALHPRTNYEGRAAHPPEAVVNARLTELNLNDRTPLWQRYVRWAGGVLRGDFGRTWQGESVNAEVGRRFGVTLRLLLLGMVLGGVIGVLLGALSAVRQYGVADRAITTGSFVVMSIPVFVLGVLLQVGAIKVNNATGVRIFEFSGEYGAGLPGGFWTQLGDRLKHLVLPTVSLAAGQIAVFSRYQRSAMLDVMAADFVRTARAKGLRRRTALLRHALRTALIPSVTYFTYTFGILLVGTTLTEKIFGWHGLGEWFVDSVGQNDVNAVAAVNCLAAVLVLVAGIASDVLYAILDPRVRVG
jgi:peptide/nickel transport system permease protein